MQRAEGVPQILVDVGDFGGTKTKSQLLKVRYLLKGMHLLNYDAINLADKDLQYGRGFLDELRQQLRLPFISANVYDAETGQRFAQPYVLKEVNGSTVAIFGVTMAAPNLMQGTGFEVRDPVQAARSMVQELRERCDVLVALAHLGLTGALDLAEQVPGIDVIISGHNGSHVQAPHRVGHTLIMQPGSKGKYLGQLDLVLRSGKLADAEGRTVALTDRIPDDPKLAELVKEYDEAVLVAFPLESPKAQTQYSFLSERTCMGCHRAEHQQWRSTLHAHAWETLVAKNQAHNPECQSCHTTLFGEANGFVSLKDNPDMVNVQCAACHRLAGGDVSAHINRVKRGPDANGARANGQTRDFLPVTEATCLGCHNEDNSPNFEYAAFLPKVTHGRQPPQKRR